MKIRLGVLFGGMSVEHEVSIITAIQAMNNLDTTKYEIVPIYIAKDGVWYTGNMLKDIEIYSDMDLLKRYAKEVVLYNTNGHLIVDRVYSVVDGKTYVICNDPNINQRFGNDKDGNPYFVYYEFPLETFMNFWRGTIYVVE